MRQDLMQELTNILDAHPKQTPEQLADAVSKSLYIIQRTISHMVKSGVAERSKCKKYVSLSQPDPEYIFVPIQSDHLIIDAIHHGNLTAKQIAFHCGIDKSSVRKRLTKLVDAKIVFYLGSRNAYTAGSAEMYYGNSPDTKIPRNWKEKKEPAPEFKPVVPFRDWLDIAFFGAAPQTRN